MLSVICLVFVSTVIICSASWSIKHSENRNLDTANITAGDSYLDDNKFTPDTLGEYFTTGKDEEGNATAIYNGKSQKPTIKDLASAQALWGDDLAPAEGQTEQAFLDSLYGTKYKVEWQAGTYANYNGNTTTQISNGDYKGVVAGKHYYRIVDMTTGSVICYKHLYSIAQYEIEGVIVYDEGIGGFVNNGAVKFDAYIGFVDGKEHTWSTKNINGIAMGGEGVVQVGTLTPKVTLDYKDADGNPWIQSSSLAASDNTLSGKVAESGFWQYDGKDIDLNNNKISSKLQYVAECYALPTTYETHSTNNTTITTYYGSLGEAIDETTSGTIYPMQSFSYSITLKDGKTVKKGTPVVGTSLKDTNGNLVNKGDYTHVLEGKTYTIGANVTLCIPYGTDYSKYFTKDELTNKDGNGDKNAFQNKDNLKNEVVIESLKDAQGNVVKDANGNVVPTLINKGTLQIPGVVSGGNGSAKYNSITAGDHSQITLGDDAVVSNPTGTIQCYGFIAEETYDNRSKVEMTGGSMDVVFSIVEHRGGTILSGMISDLQSTPFNRFYIQTVTSTLVVHEGATVSGFYDLHISLGHQYGKIGFFGNTSDVFFQFDPNDGAKKSQVTLKYDVENQQNQLDVYGSVNFNKISLSTSYGDISTANVFLPMSHYWKVQCNKFISGDAATVTALAQDIKILPGGSVTIAEGVTFKGRKIVIYSTTAPQIPDSDSASTYVYNTKADGTAVTATDGVLCVNGSLEVQYLGGPVQAGAEGATLKISSGVSVTSKEITGKYTDLTHLIIPGIYYNNANPTVSASGDLAEGTDIESKQPLSVNEQYKSSGSAWAYKRTINITYNNINGGTASDGTTPANISTTLWSNEGITLSLPTLTKTHYDFHGWYTDSSFNTKATEKTVYQSTSVWAKWTAIEYTVTFEGYVYDNFTPTGGSIALPTDEIKFTVETQNVTLPTPTHATYTFGGWYGDSSCESEEIKSGISGEKLLSLTDNGKIYGLWTNIIYNLEFVFPDTNDGAYTITTALPTTVTPVQLGNKLPVINDDATRKYYVSGWTYSYTAADGTTKTGTLAPGAKFGDFINTEIANGTKFTLTAQWKLKEYTVTVNGASGATFEDGAGVTADPTTFSTTLYFSETQVTNGITLAEDAKIKELEGLYAAYNTNVYINKYYEGGWKLGTSSITQIVAATFDGATADANGVKTVTITPEWKTKAYTITVGGSLTEGDYNSALSATAGTLYFTADQLSDAYSKLADHEGTARADDDLTNKNMYFKGWAKADGTIVTSITASDFTNGSLTLTAKWGTKHTVHVKLTNVNKGRKGWVMVINHLLTEGNITYSTNGTDAKLYFKPDETVRVSGYVEGQFALVTTLGTKLTFDGEFKDGSVDKEATSGKYGAEASWPDGGEKEILLPEGKTTTITITGI